MWRSNDGRRELTHLLMFIPRRCGTCVATMFETPINVPTQHLRELTRRLTAAGFTVLDTGDRIATDAGPDTEASLVLLQLATVETPQVELGIAR